MKRIVLLVVYILSIVLSSEQKAISPDSKRLYYDIVSGRGLYNGFDKFKELNSTNLRLTVFSKNASYTWLIEFYNSWCGHCHRFAPVWKAFASDIHGWRNVVRVSAVDCSVDENNQLCRDFEVMYYPMIKLFPQGSSETFLGKEFRKGTVETMRRSLVNELKIIHSKQATPLWPNFQLYMNNNFDKLWVGIPSHVLYTVVVFEENNSTLGCELALDLSLVKEVQVREASINNSALFALVSKNLPSFHVAVVNRDMDVLPVGIHNSTRTGMNKAVRIFLSEHGINVSLDLPASKNYSLSDVQIADVMQIMQLEDEIKKKLQTSELSSVVFQLDIEGAVRYSLRNEIPLHKNIYGEQFLALKNYVSVLLKYFPIGRNGIVFLEKIKDELTNKSEIQGKAFRSYVFKTESELGHIFLPKQGWLGCRGSRPEYRGYPCSLWTMFHALTVFAELKKTSSSDSCEVLNSMAAYIKNFFTCSECANHFTEMASTISKNVTTHDDAILWLWAAHNKVNIRLAGDPTEDPKHKKIQFPSASACPQCRDDFGNWKTGSVLQFLKSMYTNISYLQHDDVTVTPKYSKNLRHENIGDEAGFQEKTLTKAKVFSWDFNVLDISLCVFLYICSVAILVLVCIKFVFRRSYRKKSYIYDILSKV